ncbi:hypothetical protein C173_31536 [Paenibacillus sp. FSL R7-277]|uniref:hypothetical protein n=1 Tax=Paenibacillus sp. FSL R7-277 TaxID=1227352 RepID=UPI0003E21F63|nr:hypothetical protein [Paenibacillus sp. FSL R7-277]ETT57699.1 hypothetical protein C173_31536 [Paenibacillus sp. FSL R7-277]
MSAFLISVNVLLWMWQFSRFRKKRGSLREKTLVYALYAVALGLNIISAKDGFTPDLLRPFINLLQFLKPWAILG